MTININFNLPFDEAIAQMASRGVVLPDLYYGSLQGIHRQLAFSIANIAKVDQLQAVLDSLTNHLKAGGTFAQWQKHVDVKALGLPRHRLDNIFRTNIQQAYNHGHWQQALTNQATHGYLMYDAINDSRTRPSHRSNDGIIRKIDDPIWKRIWFSRSVYRCRCRLLSLTEKQAIARSGEGQGIHKTATEDPLRDKAWDSVDVMNNDLLGFGVERAIANRMAAGKVAEPLLNAFKEQQASKPTAIIDKQTLTSWADKVAQPDYNARHEFMRVGTLPDAVMADSEVFALKPVNNELYISDHQLRHSVRDFKAGKGSALPMAIVNQLPDKLENAQWFFDSKHGNLFAVFNTDITVGKSVVEINFRKKNELFNAVITSGLIKPEDLNNPFYKKIP